MSQFGLTPHKQWLYAVPDAAPQQPQTHSRQQFQPSQQSQAQQQGQMRQQVPQCQTQQQAPRQQQAPQQYQAHASNSAQPQQVQQYQQPAAPAHYSNVQPAQQQHYGAAQQQHHGQQQQYGQQQQGYGQMMGSHDTGYTEETTRKVTTTTTQQQAQQQAHQQHNNHQSLQQQHAQQVARPTVAYTQPKQQAPLPPPPPPPPPSKRITEAEQAFMRMAISSPQPQKTPKPVASSSKAVVAKQQGLSEADRRAMVGRSGVDVDETTTTKKTTTTTVKGGQMRQEAATKGTAQLERFDKQVSDMIIMHAGICGAGYPFFPCNQGYLCGGGHHFVSHREAEAMLRGQRPFGPRVEDVNQLEEMTEAYGFGDLGTKAITPPSSPKNMPCNMPWRRRMQMMGGVPLPKNSEGKVFCAWAKGYVDADKVRRS